MVLKDILRVGSADMTPAFKNLFFEDFETGIRQKFESKMFC